MSNPRHCLVIIVLILIFSCVNDINCSAPRNVLNNKGEVVDVNDGKFSFYVKESLKEVFGQVCTTDRFTNEFLVV